MSASVALAILGGSTGASTATSSPALALATLRRAATAGEEAKGTARLAKDPEVKLALSRFTEGIARAKDVNAALRDPRVMNVLLPALGLPDAVEQVGLAQRALTADPKAADSLLTRLSDTRWKSAATTLNLSARGMDALRDPAVQKKLTEGFLSYKWRTSQDKDATGVSDALYFEQRVATGKALSVWEVLGDASLRRLVTGALGLPDSLAIQSVETQARAVAWRLDLSKITDTKSAAKIAERYVMSAASANGGGTVSSPLLSLFT
ncbi:DUF1217 domain-containing protein [Muricoccus radiodurans]|uniref:DUF1217 domain-containing protein n=1 Tax=Muricoccus radiodurans TaxID=2231721 RepID=UPI003CEB3958